MPEHIHSVPNVRKLSFTSVGRYRGTHRDSSAGFEESIILVPSHSSPAGNSTNAVRYLHQKA